MQSVIKAGRRPVLLLFFLFIQTVSFSQQVSFEHLSDKEGLVNSNVTAILKDSYGYMWIGTFNGLSRFDGYTFTNYLNDPQNIHTINDNWIEYIFESKDRNLFIGFHHAGFAIYNREADTFTRFRHNPKNNNSLSGDEVLTQYEDKNGNFWIGTRGGFDKFDARTKSFTHYAAPQDSGFFVSSIAEDKQGNMWLYKDGSHVYTFDPHSASFTRINLGEGFDFSRTASWSGVICYDKRGNLWVGSEGGGLCRFNTKIGTKDWYTVSNGKLKSNMIFSILEDFEGKIWIGTDGAGVYRYDYEKNSFEVFKHDPDDPGSLSGDGVYCIYESDPGVIWVGVYSAGLNVYKKYKKKFLKFDASGTSGHRLTSQAVTGIAEASDGKIWVGTNGGWLNLYDPKTQLITSYTPDNSPIFQDIIVPVYVERNKNLWLGSYGKGLCRVKFENGKVKEIKNYRGDISGKGETILSDHAWSITESSDNKIWIGLLNFGVNVYDPATSKFSYYPFDTAAYNQAAANIYAVYEDSHKRLWAGSEASGAGYFDPEKKAFVRFTYQEGVPGSISSNHIRDIFEDSKGNLWFATIKGGLNRLVDIKKGKFEAYTVKDGLPSNNIQKILEDDHHNLWLGTDKGLSLFKPAEKKCINFDTEDGLQGDEFNVHGGARGRDGHMYFGGTQGFNVFHPDSIRFNTLAPSVVLTDFKIFSESIIPNKSYKNKVYLKKAIGLAHEITLTHEDYVFSVEFAALDFTSPGKNKYAYRLIGFNDEWTYVNADKRFATYTNLNPGTYTFQVIACNNDGYWNKSGVSFRIVVLPAWWQTWWFRALVLVSLLLSVAAFYYIRLYSMRKRNRFLEEEVKKRTLELEEANEDLRERNEETLKQNEQIAEQKNELEEKSQELEHLNKTKDKFFSIIGHDLKGPVKALTSLTGLLKEETGSMANEKQKALASHIDVASHKIEKLVLSLLSWAQTQSRQIKVHPVAVSVPRLFKENIELLSPQANQKQIHIECEAHDSCEVWGDYDMITTIIRNVLSNSIKYTLRGGVIKLTAIPAPEGAVKLSVSDNGIGMSKEILAKLFSLEKNTSMKGTDNETGTGLGLLISKEFAELNKGKIYAESEEGKGSVFFLVLPAIPEV